MVGLPPADPLLFTHRQGTIHKVVGRGAGSTALSSTSWRSSPSAMRPLSRPYHWMLTG